jgi:hypothetical protein
VPDLAAAACDCGRSGGVQALSGHVGVRICAMTIEHASQRTDIPGFSYEQIAA